MDLTRPEATMHPDQTTGSAAPDVVAILREHLLELLPDLDPAAVTPQASLRDLGANSVDRADIVTMTMDRLGLRVPVRAFTDAVTLGDLAAVMQRHPRPVTPRPS
jgi:polyketide biosynthesis acyl carrier protein